MMRNNSVDRIILRAESIAPATDRRFTYRWHMAPRRCRRRAVKLSRYGHYGPLALTASSP